MRSRNFTELHPQPDALPVEESAMQELREWAHLQNYTGVGYVRINFNQGGITAAKAMLEKPLPNH